MQGPRLQVYRLHLEEHQDDGQALLLILLRLGIELHLQAILH